MGDFSKPIIISALCILFAFTTAAASFGDPGSDPVPNLTSIKVYDVSGLTQQKKRTSGVLEAHGIEKLNLVIDDYEVYRFDFRISNNGSKIWRISPEDMLEYSGLDASWKFKEAFYNITDVRSGGNFTSGTVRWNTSKGGKLYPKGENSTMRASFILNISSGIPQKTTTDFLVNDTSNNSGSQKTQVLSVNESGYLNVSILRPPTDTVLQRNRTFKLTGEVECLGGVCGRIDLTPRYNKSSFTPTTVIPEPVSKPFYVKNKNQKTCSQNLARGNTCRANFTVNATGSVGSDHLLDVNASSNITEVMENDSADSSVEIKSTVIIDLSWQTISFGSVDPGRRNVSAKGNSNLQYNLTVPEESREVDNLYINASPLISKENSDYSILPENITHSFSQTGGGGTQLSEAFKRIKISISPGTVLQNFFYLDVPYGLTTGEYRGAITFKANSTFSG
ncbi:MAG: hypothetical protein ABEK10_00505 [Candidatus Nanosalina sp.]